MVCLPLIERELRVALRKQRPAQGRLKVAALAAISSMMLLLLGALTGAQNMGQFLEEIFWMAGLYFVLRAPMLTAGALAEERQNQTLGLLFLSGLSAGEVFAGKFLSSALVAFTNLLAIFPMLALPFLTGGVSYDLFLAIVCALPVLMLFALAVSLLASVLTRDDGMAVILAIVLGAMFCALTPAVYLAGFSSGGKPSLWWLRLSPAYGPRLVWSGFGSGFRAGQRAEFWRNLVVTLGWSLSALGAAAFALKRIWREREQEEGTGGRFPRWRKFAHGGRESRQRLGRAWLDVNSFVWLAGRDRQPEMVGWMVVGGITVAWLAVWAVWRGKWANALNFYITAAVLNVMLGWLTRYTAAQFLSQPRRDGAYEMLLTTPLDPSDMVRGGLEALRGHFRSLANFVLGLNAFMMAGGLLTRTWNVGALIVYFCIWSYLLIWSWNLGHRWSQVLPAMWAGLNCGRAVHAVWRISAFKGRYGSWIWFWNIYLFGFVFMGRGFQEFPTGSIGEVFLVGWITSCWLIWRGGRAFMRARHVRDLMYRQAQWKASLPFLSDDVLRDLEWSSDPMDRNQDPAGYWEKRITREFREIVREPLPDPADPRFKRWNVAERFPWGWALVQQQLPERLARR